MSEICPTCGQPDNCGDCDHTPPDEDSWAHEMSDEPEQPEHFQERFKDINVEEAIVFGDGSVQVNGHDLDGRKVWILLHVRKPVEVKFHM